MTDNPDDPQDTEVVNLTESLFDVDVSAYVKQKDRFSYLSWPFAIEVLGKYHPAAEIVVQRFPLPSNLGIEVPYLETPLGFFVEVSVVINQVKRSQLHPVFDYRNEFIATPTVIDINKSIQRAMVKAIALHGLGLFVYQGEDLPINTPDYSSDQYAQFSRLIETDDALGLYLLFQAIPLNAVIALNGSFPKGQKGKMKELVKRLELKGADLFNEYQAGFVACIDGNDEAGLLELAEEMGPAGKSQVWLKLNKEHQLLAREMLSNSESVR